MKKKKEIGANRRPGSKKERPTTTGNEKRFDKRKENLGSRGKTNFRSANTARKEFLPDEERDGNKRIKPVSKSHRFDKRKKSFQREFKPRNESFPNDETSANKGFRRSDNAGRFDKRKKSFHPKFKPRNESFPNDETPVNKGIQHSDNAGQFDKRKKDFHPKFKPRNESFSNDETSVNKEIHRSDNAGRFEKRKKDFHPKFKPRNESFSNNETSVNKEIQRSGNAGRFEKRKDFRRGDKIKNESVKSHHFDDRRKDFRPANKKRNESLVADEMAVSKGIQLNKFLSNAGIDSRRKCEELIENGLVTVNDQVVKESGYRVQRNDIVKYKEERVLSARKYYVLLNKPKDYITTTSDEHGRKTVMELIEKASPERLYPVGRLDRNTTGLLLFTNDGELAQKLTHPSKKIKKVYEVTLDKELDEEDMKKIRTGIELEDGIATVDEIAYVNEADKRIIGIELHIGKNRIVRRIFESFGNDIVKLDRVLYAGLTKKNLPRGHWRFLTEREVRELKYFG